jgi:hypothetical protein
MTADTIAANNMKIISIGDIFSCTLSRDYELICKTDEATLQHTLSNKIVKNWTHVTVSGEKDQPAYIQIS